VSGGSDALDGVRPEAARNQVSAAELGSMLFDSLPDAASIGEGELALVDAARTLLDAVLRTGLDDESRAGIAGHVQGVIDELRRVPRDDLVRLARHPDGRIENLVQAAAGRCNPRSLRLTFDDMSLPTPEQVGVPVEVTGRVVLDASAAGPPERAHGGIVATILDEATGVAMMRTGRTGMTVAIDVSYHAGVPIGVPLEVRARVTEMDGRKTRATAEVVVDGTVAARASALFVASRAASGA
jgi:acyl-coenzyme A thioesterase PaaI-like protein